jgi:protein TonB
MGFEALPDQRWLEPPKPSALAAKGRFALILLICFVLHAVPIAVSILLDRSSAPAPAEQEIPVEVIVEPPPKPPEPPPAPKEEKKPEPVALDEKIATDAPRAKNDEKLMTEARDDASHAPERAQAAAPPAAKPVESRTAESRTAEAAAPEPPPLLQSADGEPVAPADVPRPDAQRRKAEQAAPSQTPEKGQDPFPAFAALPNYSFTPPSRALVAGGKAAQTYLSTLYGMVTARMRAPASLAAQVRAMGSIDFSIDLSGRLLRERVVQSSGSPELDAIALAAIRKAAPFPPPPTGTGLNLYLHYGK